MMVESQYENAARERKECRSSSTKILGLLNLPLDVLKAILKEVTHTNDLTALALTHSCLHDLVIPMIYSRFDIVWPDAQTPMEPRTGVDALTYGLATLVMREDLFEYAMSDQTCQDMPSCQAFTCNHCGRINHQTSSLAKKPESRRSRRGNHFSQFTKKFSLGNGPSDLVEEYLITKEGGKMLGTLVALSIARMPNLESFVWDMPTGILRDLWQSLSTLGRFEHQKLQSISIRFHNNFEALRESGLVRTSQPPSGQVYPGLFPEGASTNTVRTPALILSANFVEGPSFSILPPLKSICVKMIDEMRNLEELAVLVEKSSGVLRSLKVSMAPKLHTSGLSPESQGIRYLTTLGTLGLLLSGLPNLHPSAACPAVRTHKQSLENSASQAPDDDTFTKKLSEDDNDGKHLSLHPARMPVNGDTSVSLSSVTVDTTAIDPVLVQTEDEPFETTRSKGHKCHVPPPIASAPLRQTCLQSEERPVVVLQDECHCGKSTTHNSTPRRLSLETLELERHNLDDLAIRRGIDWSFLTSLTILDCVRSTELWNHLKTTYAPMTKVRSLVTQTSASGLARKNGSLSRLRRMPSLTRSSKEDPSLYQLRLKHIHTNTVSTQFLSFVKETLAPHSLHSLFLQDQHEYHSPVTTSQIFKGLVKRHSQSLQKLLVCSAHGPLDSRLRVSSAKKWTPGREYLDFIVAPGRMPQLRELSISIEYKNWHFFLQQLPQLGRLRSLHIPHIADHIYGSHVSFRELAMGVVDVINLRQECQLAYFAIGQRCYEIHESRIRPPGQKRGISTAGEGHMSGDDSSEAISLADDTDDETASESSTDNVIIPNQALATTVSATSITTHPNMTIMAPEPQVPEPNTQTNNNATTIDNEAGADTNDTDEQVANDNANDNDTPDTLHDDNDDDDDDTDSDGTDLNESPSPMRVKMRLREILFYDEKIAIFKARHAQI